MSANHVTFVTLLNAVGQLLPPGGEERNSVASSVFAKAVAVGQVNYAVLQSLQRAVDSNVLYDMLVSSRPQGERMSVSQNGVLDFNRIPEKWSRNVQKYSY